MDASQAMDALSECYQALRSDNNDDIQRATEILTNIYLQADSIPLHIEFLKTMSDVIMKRHALVGLSKAISNVWGTIPNQNDVFVELLHLMTHEVHWQNR